MAKDKQEQKPQRRCIFCNNIGLTKQHMWPAWLGRDPELPSYTKTIDSKLHENIGDRGIDIITKEGPSRLVLIPEENSVKNVHPGTRKFLNVCQTCNNGWMSRIEDECAPIVKQLILNKTTSISDEQQVSLAKWATLMTIMAEFAYTGNQAITPDERAEFYTHKQPGSNFNVFLGRYVGTHYKQQHLHTGNEVGSQDSILHRPGYELHANFQVSVFIIGSMLLYVVSTSYKPLQPAASRFTYNGLAKIWPAGKSVIEWSKLRGLDDRDVETLYKGVIRLIPFM
jgi:hypothetical protein